MSPSNDGWIVGRAFAEQMLAVAGLRAVEQRRYLIRASTSGPSAIVDPWGRVVVRTASFARGSLLGSVRRERGLTPYARLGDAFAGLCVVVLGCALLGARRG